MLSILFNSSFFYLGHSCQLLPHRPEFRSFTLLTSFGPGRIRVTDKLLGLLLLLPSCSVLAHSHLDRNLGGELIGLDFSLLSEVLIVIVVVMELALAPVLATFGLL